MLDIKIRTHRRKFKQPVTLQQFLLTKSRVFAVGNLFCNIKRRRTCILSMRLLNDKMFCTVLNHKIVVMCEHRKRQLFL